MCASGTDLSRPNQIPYNGVLLFFIAYFVKKRLWGVCRLLLRPFLVGAFVVCGKGREGSLVEGSFLVEAVFLAESDEFCIARRRFCACGPTDLRHALGAEPNWAFVGFLKVITPTHHAFVLGAMSD